MEARHLHEARRTGDLCGACGTTFADDDPRMILDVAPGEGFTKVVVCWECNESTTRADALADLHDDRFDPPYLSCPGCNRPLDASGVRLISDPGDPGEQHAFVTVKQVYNVCSDRCYSRMHARFVRENEARYRGEDREDRCAQCGKRLGEDGRRDRRYCSSACRVARHRGKEPTKPPESENKFPKTIKALGLRETE